MGTFLLGVLLGFIIGIALLSYKIVYLNVTNPDGFDDIIKELRKHIAKYNN